MSELTLTQEQLIGHFDCLNSSLIHNEFEKWKAVIIDSHTNLLAKLETAEQESNNLKALIQRVLSIPLETGYEGPHYRGYDVIVHTTPVRNLWQEMRDRVPGPPQYKNEQETQLDFMNNKLKEVEQERNILKSLLLSYMRNQP